MRHRKKSANNVKQIVWHLKLFAKHVQKINESSNGKKAKFLHFIIISIWRMRRNLSIAKVQSVEFDFMTL